MGERVLLDTHALIWWFFEQEKLPDLVFSVIESGDNDVFVSAVSAMEIMTKARRGKLGIAKQLATNFSRQITDSDFLLLPITADHAEKAGGLVIAHRDPWDRLLIAQAQSENLLLVSNEKLFDEWSVRRLW